MGLKPLYIFDLDGTLALIDHRRHLVADKKNQRWDDFYRACVDDKPNTPIIDLANYLWHSGADIKFFSGRSDLVKNETKEWLIEHIPFMRYYETSGRLYSHLLKMRNHGDSTPDDVLKRQWYDALKQKDKDRLACVFDDRQKVVDMWRSIGVTCLQVAEGDF